MLHALFLLGFMLLAAPLASYIPLSALAGLLTVVAWNMIETQSVAALLRSSRGDALVLIVTFLLVVFRDLTEGIVVGFALGAVLFIDRMSKTIAVEAHTPSPVDDIADEANGGRQPYHAEVASDPDTVVYRISGAFFFAAASTVGAILDSIADQRRNFILDCSAVPFLDSTAASVIEGTAHKAGRAKVRFFIAGASAQARRMLFAHNVRPPRVRYKSTIEGALRQIEQEDGSVGVSHKWHTL
jgi:SulP family sulfate permease